MADIAAGWYYSMDREGDNFLFRLAQAKKADGTPCVYLACRFLDDNFS